MINVVYFKINIFTLKVDNLFKMKYDTNPQQMNCVSNTFNLINDTRVASRVIQMTPRIASHLYIRL